ncbi:MAG: HAMP domain-containing sensor histidine kinase [bacterium]
MTRKLSSVLTIWYAVSFLIILGATFLVTWTAVDRHFQSQIDEDLWEDLEEFREYYQAGGLSLVKKELIRESGPGDADSEFFRVISPTGVVAASRNIGTLSGIGYDSAAGLSDISQKHQFHSSTLQIETGPGADVDKLEFREITGIIGPNLILHMGESVSWKSETMNILRHAFFSILGLGIPLISLIGWLMARRAVSGVEQVSSIAERIHRGHMDERVHTSASEIEVIRLSGAFNAMLDRIRDLVIEMREMTDNIAHDLKSPLARIRFMSEVALSRNLSHEEQDENALQTIEECDRLITMINTSLDVAEAEAGICSSERTKFDFSSLVEDACDLFQPVAEGQSIALEYEIQEGCWFSGNLVHLQRVVSNLIDNALKYTPSGGSVNVRFEYDDDNLVVSVTDTGVGIADEDRESIFKRFYRCDRSRSKEGCGLGLSYARAIVRQYGGEITFESALQLGSTFVLILPFLDQIDSETGHSEINQQRPKLQFDLAHDS